MIRINLWVASQKQIGATRNSKLHEVLNLIDVYCELHPSAKKFTRFQINPLTASKLDYFLSENFYFQIKECDIVPTVKSDHKIVTLLFHHNSSPENLIITCYLDDQYISKTKIAIADCLLNNPEAETNPHTRWKALKWFLPGHTINY